MDWNVWIKEINYCCYKSQSKILITIFVNIIKVDGGDSMLVSSLQHAASQAPVLGVRAELQDLVTIVIVTIIATWI